jgi:hypothetical protein
MNIFVTRLSFNLPGIGIGKLIFHKAMKLHTGVFAYLDLGDLD